MKSLPTLIRRRILRSIYGRRDSGPGKTLLDEASSLYKAVRYAFLFCRGFVGRSGPAGIVRIYGYGSGPLLLVRRRRCGDVRRSRCVL